MNCRRVNGLLSAYLDGELTGAEMLDIRAHLDNCGSCHREHQALRDTKHLVASLAYKAPRADLESLLADRTYRGGERRVIYPIASAAESGTGLRPWPIAATILLSLTGLYLASTALNPPGSSGSLYDNEVAPPLLPIVLTSRMEDSPVALTDVPSNMPVAIWSGNAPMGTVAVGAPMLMAGNAPLTIPSNRFSASVTVMSNGRGDTVRVISQSLASGNGLLTVTSTTTSSPLVSNPAPTWLIRGNRVPVEQMPVGGPPAGTYMFRRIGIRPIDRR